MEQTRQHRQAGQSTAEYAIVLGVVITALVGMQLYIKRGLNAKVKNVTDHLTTQIGSGDQTLKGAFSETARNKATVSNFLADRILETAGKSQ